MSIPREAPADDYGLVVLRSPARYRELVRAHPEQALLSLPAIVPGLRLDIRYATPHNLLGRPLYPQPAAYLRQPAAEALGQVQQALRRQDVGLVVYDAYRPYSATVALYQAVQDEHYAAPPWRGSRHNRGCAVDVGLVELSTGQPLPMPTDFDALSPAAHTSFEPVSSLVRRHRTLLLTTMQAHGFQNYPGEWWHYDYARWGEFGLLDLPFSAL
ncbi:M15 family metallopeptidase [Hymenobacter sp. BT18]|uniref:M15 family metallopeptidase n=1 Tax=Hymenobacter sp. BT18 TaxID=2835648 RepID=UPI00143E6505|nr:M15 family metallopeptidase [Hymenobacter sp. BT18]QIX60269.1 M15 family metallopeptidase [Hymenobacter sp. BT18]